MLHCMELAVAVSGKRNRDIAVDVCRTAQTVTGWLAGRLYVPRRSRNALCMSLGTQIDWDNYESEYAAYRAARQHPPAPPDDTRASQAPKKMPPQPRECGTATLPAKHAKMPVSGAPVAPARKSGGILGIFFDPDDNGAKFA